MIWSAAWVRTEDSSEIASTVQTERLLELYTDTVINQTALHIDRHFAVSASTQSNANTKMRMPLSAEQMRLSNVPEVL